MQQNITSVNRKLTPSKLNMKANSSMGHHATLGGRNYDVKQLKPKVNSRSNTIEH